MWQFIKYCKRICLESSVGIFMYCENFLKIGCQSGFLQNNFPKTSKFKS